MRWSASSESAPAISVASSTHCSSRGPRQPETRAVDGPILLAGDTPPNLLGVATAGLAPARVVGVAEHNESGASRLERPEHLAKHAGERLNI